MEITGQQPVRVKPTMAVGDRVVGPDQACFVVAEIGNNHDGSLDQALELIEAASLAGADAVKFQTFKASRLVSEQPVAPPSLWRDAKQRSWQEVFLEWELPRQWHERLAAAAADHDVVFFSTAFDPDSVDFLESVGVQLHKIASFEITYSDLLKKVASTGKPLLLSTGASTLDEVSEALQLLEGAGCGPVALLHCGSCYPLAVEDVNLRAMSTLARKFNRPVGYSDHTLGTETTLAAVALGACVIEKHFTLNKNLPGPDHAVSMEPEELKAMIASIRRVEAALGSEEKKPVAAEAGARSEGRRSLHAARDITAGSVITEEDVTVVRPAAGIAPRDKEKIMGLRTRSAMASGQPITWSDLR